jgi:hypothetical protein
MTDRNESFNDVIEAMETLAQVVGAHAICKPKYNGLSVEFPQLPKNEEHTKALYVFAELIEATTA